MIPEQLVVRTDYIVNGNLWQCFPVINVDKVKDIPADYPGAMGVPITFLDKFSREQVEKVWRGEWMGSGDGYADGELVYDTWECSHCGHVIDEEDDPDMLPQFCPKCYAAMTDEAVQMVMERLEALHENIYNG